ncbi:hypothetical protein POM88_038788 [Heracleum sosnowskyi]|uniref:Reverse transcriptase domain-containing protein n=1 Tax=Heracleum sosnowskyi TaxID=360622 RepID=A0AAD8M8B2_9APIA|nr:hypothetical protein POM88_038788 [Heracleum sosnowskyi]
MFGERKVSHEPVVSKEIEQYRPPSGGQFPKMNEFNGKGDPEDHCEKRFLRHYSHLCRREKDTEALIHCRQRPNEELGDYLARFKEEAGMVTNLDKVKAAGFLAARLDPVKDKKLRSSLYDIPPKSLNDIYVRGEAIRRKLESIGGYKESRKNESSIRDDRRSRGDFKSRLTDNRPDRGAERRRDRDSTVFTPLNAPISQILHEIKGKPGFVRPARMKTPDYKKNGDKYCEYHKDKGHNTDECYHLKKLIEKMVKGGELEQYKGDLRDKLESKEPRREKGPEKEEKYRAPAYHFTEDDFEDVIWPHEDPLIINPIIEENKIWKVLVDGGSLVNILYHRTYCKMNLGGEQLEPCHEAPLYGFRNQPVPIEGTITLPIVLGKAPYTMEKEAKFYVVRVESPYNSILGRPILSAFQAVASVPHLKLKFPTENGIGEMRGDQKAARIIMLEDIEKDRDVEMTEGGKRKRKEDEGGSHQMMNIELEKFGADLSNPIAEPAAETEEVELYVGQSGKMIQIGKNMEPELKKKVIEVIRQYHDVFAWGHEDMPGLDPSVAKHCLSVNPDEKLVKQKKRNFAMERQQVIQAEVEKLLKSKFIEEIEYPDWLANLVVVKKSNNKWRMCVNYTDLNKACPKDHYPLPNIDQLIDATSGHQVLSFLDAFSGYHQITMNVEDIPKTAFITPKGTYAYIKMPFGLKNAGATFQKMINKVFKEQIGRNVECYVDDMIVKSMFKDHAEDLRECFETLRKNNMRINPSKCTFGVASDKGSD